MDRVSPAASMDSPRILAVRRESDNRACFGTRAYSVVIHYINRGYRFDGEDEGVASEPTGSRGSTPHVVVADGVGSCSGISGTDGW